MRLRTKVFELYPGYYRSLTQLAHAMGISVSQVCRVRSGKRNINQTFIIGALSAFQQFSFGELFYLAREFDGFVTEEALRESEELYRAVFEQAADSVMLIDAETGALVDFNDRAHETLGYTREEFKKLKIPDIEVIESAEEVAKRIEKIVNEGADAFETKHRRKGGEILDIEVRCRAISIAGRNFIQGMWRDITEHKRAEEAVRESEERFRTLTERASEGISIVGAEGTILYESPSIERILGYRPEDRVGKQPFESLHPDDVSEAAKAYQFLIDNPDEIVTMVIRSRHKDGSWRWMECVGRNLLEDARVHGLVINYRDITGRKRAEQALQRHTKGLEALHSIGQMASQTLDLEQMLDNAVEKVIEVLDVDVAAISIVDEATGESVIKAHRGLSQEFIASIGRMKLEPDELERTLAWKQKVAPSPENVLNEPNLERLMAAAIKEGLESNTIVRLLARGSFLGSVSVSCRHPREFTSEDMDLIIAIADQIAVGIENSRLFAEVSHSATVDALTGLYNHRYFQERLEEETLRVIRFGGECSLLILDLDHFKIYNDLFGHVAGDEVLKRIGQILRDHTRQVDIACRYGGEEFAVVLPQTGSTDTYEAAERLRQAVEAALPQESTRVGTPITISLGVASYPSDGLSREELILNADRALREAKDRGGNQTCLASDVSEVARAGEMSWELAEHLEAASLNTIYALAAAVDARDHYTYGHSRNVSKYAVAIGKALGLSRRTQERLRICALLHDIGKIGLPDSIIRKSDPLDEEEWEIMRKHSELGATIISHTPELADCAPAIRHHHEWHDGRGYPHGLKGEDIPLEARIIAIADAYDTMTTPRAYRQMASPQQAMEELRLCAGTQFDPELVEAFCQAMSEATKQNETH